MDGGRQGNTRVTTSTPQTLLPVTRLTAAMPGRHDEQRVFRDDVVDGVLENGRQAPRLRRVSANTSSPEMPWTWPERISSPRRRASAAQRWLSFVNAAVSRQRVRRSASSARASEGNRGDALKVPGPAVQTFLPSPHPIPFHPDARRARSSRRGRARGSSCMGEAEWGGPMHRSLRIASTGSAPNCFGSDLGRPARPAILRSNDDRPW